MKLKFTIQKFQTDAVNAVTDLFKGQESQESTFSIIKNYQGSQTQFAEYEFGNQLIINDEKILENMHEVQKRNELPLTTDVSSKNFCIEMETGTGKTYVYTKTIFELNRKYGFKKFIIVVPSVAIREGVYKSFEVTKEHFLNQYGNVPYRYFIYDSKKINDIKRFAMSQNIEIMIINIVYIYLLVWHGEEEFKSRAKMADDLSITNITLGKYLGKLCEKGYISRTQTRKDGKFGICSYTILK